MSNWHQLSRLSDDQCYQRWDHQSSQVVGQYQLSGYNPQHSGLSHHLQRVTEVYQFPRVYHNTLDYSQTENQLRAQLTNTREQHQLFQRPYLGNYMGAGQSSLDNKNLESNLFQGVSTNQKSNPCLPSREAPSGQFNSLPEFGNPQRSQHIIPPEVNLGGWVRGGDNTRDYVRRIDFNQRCLGYTSLQRQGKQRCY